MISKEKLEVYKKIKEEFNNIQRMGIIGMSIGLFDENNIFEWKAALFGPKDTPYKGGLFYIKIIFPEDYPNGSPRIFFLTPIIHVNVNNSDSSDRGLVDINCLGLYRHEYLNNSSIIEILSNIISIFYIVNPNCWSLHDEEIKRDLFNNMILYKNKIKYFTKKYAHPLKKYTNLEKWNFTYFDDFNYILKKNNNKKILITKVNNLENKIINFINIKLGVNITNKEIYLNLNDKNIGSIQLLPLKNIQCNNSKKSYSDPNENSHELLNQFNYNNINTQQKLINISKENNDKKENKDDNFIFSKEFDINLDNKNLLKKDIKEIKDIINYNEPLKSGNTFFLTEKKMILIIAQLMKK